MESPTLPSETPTVSSTIGPDIKTFPYFSHLPRIRDKESGEKVPVRGAYRRWPGKGDSPQYLDTTRNRPTFHDVWVWVEPFLVPKDTRSVEHTSKTFHLGSRYSSLHLTKPWQPDRRRRWGFGKTSKDRTLSHDTPHLESLIHFAWPFLTPMDREKATRVCPVWDLYPSLRKKACLLPVSELHRPRGTTVPTTLCPRRALLHSVALLRFNFHYGDMVRWMGGEYTNRHQNWSQQWDKLLRSRTKRPLPPDYPNPDWKRAYRVQTEGVPLKAHYTSPAQETVARDRYDNHPAVKANQVHIEAKFAKEEFKSYHIHFFRSLYKFIPGVMINPIQWAFDKGKGRICIDCTNGPDPAGSVNTQIPKPGTPERIDECPPVWYQFAFKRLLRRIYRLRQSRPGSRIMVHADDVEAAFRRVLYHPDIAPAFAYVFDKFLICPVGQVFGSRSAPSYYCLLADVRQALATMADYGENPEEFDPLVTNCTMQLVDSPVTEVPYDPHHPTLTEAEVNSPFNAAFVDDTGVVSLLEHINRDINQSVKSAEATFGPFGEDRRGDCLQSEKWSFLVAESFKFLGFIVNTHEMTVTWPREKREDLHALLMEVRGRKGKLRFVTPKEMATLVGILRSASIVSPYGTFLSFNLQNALFKAGRKAQSRNRRWWNRTKIRLCPVALRTIDQLLETLQGEAYDSLWTRPIGFMLERTPTHSVFSDASYLGIGGWSPCFGFMWRVVREDLLRCGFAIQSSNASDSRMMTDAEVDDENPLHINPLEFLACLINLWLSLKSIMTMDPRVGGYILALWSDNTTALSWMSVASRTPDPFLQGLARLGAGLLVHAHRFLTLVQPLHIPGDQNGEADALSRPEDGTQTIPSLNCVIEQWPRLRNCQTYLLPLELLQIVAEVTSCRQTVESYDELTTKLLTLEVVTLDSGVDLSAWRSTIYNNFQRTR